MPCDYKQYAENWKWLSKQIVAEHIEMYAAAFLKETNLKASECVLIQRQEPDRLFPVYEFKKKDAPENENKK